MKGLELCERFYYEYGEPMLKEKFKDILGYIAVGLVGSGSECFGYDDSLSQDHDFEAGFCIFLPDESVVDSKVEFALERAYSKLPSEFMGVSRSKLNPAGGNRHGVIQMSEFFKSRTGSEDGVIATKDWFFLPEQALAEATGGKIFFDGYGEFSKIRERLRYMPEDVRRKKLAGNLLMAVQAGQYNYPRSIARGESGAAQLAIYEFFKSAVCIIFLINRHYAPYYKWSFRALGELPVLSHLSSQLEYLISSDNSKGESVRKQSTVSAICCEILQQLRREFDPNATVTDLEGAAYAINDSIVDESIRNLNILYAV